MKHSSFGNFGGQVSRIAFGAMGLGGAFGEYEESELIRSVLHSLERGVTIIDTARGYGNSEKLVGRALKEWRGEPPFIASKVQSMAPGYAWGMPCPLEQAYPPGSVRAGVEESLQQLGLDCIDLMQMHQYWPMWEAVEYWLDELHQLKKEGKIRFIGVSLPDHRHDIALPLVQSGRIDSIQTIINIFDPLAFDCLVPACERHGVAVIARCVLDEGGLTGFLKEDTSFADRDFRKSFFASASREENISRVERLKKFVPEHADSLAQLAIKFVLHHPAVTTANVSMHIMDYADENIAALEQRPLPDDIFTELRLHHRWVRNFYTGKYW
jgi:methylglyoxal reductase